MCAAQVYQFHCPEGLHYDSAIASCNWPDAAKCQLKPIATLYR